LSLLEGQREDALRQRLRELTYAAVDKKGEQRQELDVSSCFGPLLRWVVSWWAADEKRLALALDASTLGHRFTVLSVSVVYQGCAIPVAWVVLSACEPGQWKPYWLKLLDHLRGSVPADWMVIAMTDRGLYAKWLFRAIQRLGWHPFMRVHGRGTFRSLGQAQFLPLASVVSQVGAVWSGQVACFAAPTARLKCTLLARWDEGYTDPWLILTDLPSDTATAAWYGMRSWIEQGFKDCKRGGLHWEQTKMVDPARATRLWLAIALATLWMVSVGGQLDASLPSSSLPTLPHSHIARRLATGLPRPRRLSCFRRGLIAILVSLISGSPLPLGSFISHPWPSFSPSPSLRSPAHALP
jgi:hypothetical protein